MGSFHQHNLVGSVLGGMANSTDASDTAMGKFEVRALLESRPACSIRTSLTLRDSGVLMAFASTV